MSARGSRGRSPSTDTVRWRADVPGRRSIIQLHLSGLEEKVSLVFLPNFLFPLRPQG